MVSLSTLLFGLARGFYSSLIARTIVGITNGLSIIGKTLSTEISTPELKSWSVSITNTFWALGSTLGPYLGAKCYDSHSISPSLSGSISVSAFGLVLIFLALYHLREMNSSIAKVTNCNISLLINKPNVKHLIFVFSTNTFFSSVITEIIPYWTAASYDRGGLGFDYTQISRIYLGMIVPQICAQLLLYPLLDKIKSSIWILKLGHLIHLLTFTLLPMGHFIRSDVLIIIWIVSWMVLRNIASFINFATLQKLTNDIVQADMRGRLNAIQIITSSIFQIIGMFMGGWLIAFTMTSEFVFPFNYYFVFIILSLVSLLSLFVINKINLASFDYIQNETVLQ